MILLADIPSETPLRMVAQRLEDAGTDFMVLIQRQFADSDIHFEVNGERVSGELRIRDSAWPLEDIRAAYLRLMDDRCLPELEDEPEGSPARMFCRAFHDTLTRWMEIAPGRVVNRCAHGDERFEALPDATDPAARVSYSRDADHERPRAGAGFPRATRPYHLQVDQLRSFDLQEFTDAEEARLESLRWCPTQFQAFVERTNLRVHTVGDEVFATAACTDATDYRYASRQSGAPAELREGGTI